MGFLSPQRIGCCRFPAAAPPRQLVLLAILTLGLAAAPVTSWAQAIDGGNEHALAIQPDGTVVAWGSNADGKASVPAVLSNPGGSPAVAIAGGNTFSLALREDGSIVGWGSDAGAIHAPTGDGFTAIAAGTNHGLAVTSSGAVEAWDSSGPRNDVPTDLTTAVAVAGGNQHSLALLSDGKVTGWGINSGGQIDPLEPMEDWVTSSDMFAGQEAAAISAGVSHSLALRTDGGLDSGTFKGEYTGDATVTPTLSGVVSIASGNDHSLALMSDGTVQAWGRDDESQVGDMPTGLSDVVAIGAGGNYSMAVLNDGSVVTWGDSPAGAPPTNVATTAEWASAADGNYLESYRWTHGTPSTLAADTLFNATGSDYTVSFQTNAHAASLSIEAGEVTFALGGNEYTVANALAISDGASLTLDNGSVEAVTVTNDGVLNNNATLTATTSFTNTGDLTNNGTIVGNVTVQDGGEISGTGTVQGDLTIGAGGTISPGNSIGTLDVVSGDLIFAAGSAYSWEISDWTGMPGVNPGTPGSDWDLVNVSGGMLDLTGLNTDNPFSLSLTTLEDLDGFDPYENYSWTIVQAANGINGASGQLDPNIYTIDSSGFLSGQLTGTFSLFVDGNSLMLNHAAIPEPSSILFALMGTGAGAFYMRRKRKQAADETAEETPAIA